MYYGISISMTYTQICIPNWYTIFPTKNSGSLTDREESKFKVVLERRERLEKPPKDRY